MRICDECGARVSDTIGSPQCSMFDVTDDPRVGRDALDDLRHGAILCPACVRAVALFDAADLAQARAEVFEE